MDNKGILSVNKLLRQSLSDGIFRGASVAFIFQVTGAGLGYLSQVVLARYLGVNGYGEYTFTISWVMILSILAECGFTTSLLRFIPEYLVKKQWPYLKGILKRSWLIGLVFGLIISSVMFIILPHLSFISQSEVGALMIGIWLVPFYALTNLQKSMAQGLKKMVIAFAPNAVIRPSILICSLIVIYTIQRHLTSDDALILTIIAFSVAILFQFIFISMRSIPKILKEVNTQHDNKKWFSVSLPLLMIGGFYVILDRTDVILIGILSSAREVGIYNAASRTALLVSFILSAVNAIAAPNIAALFAEKKMGELQELAKKIAHMCFWPTIGIAIFMIVLSKQILALFGNDFIHSGNILIVLMIGQVFNASVGSVGYLLNMTGHQKDTARVFGVAAIINVFFNILGIHFYGAIGAAFATAGSLIIWNSWLYIIVVKKLKIHSSILFALIS